MNDFVIIADSGCDLPDKVTKNLNIELIDLKIIKSDGGVLNITSADEFYEMMIGGLTASTCAVNSQELIEKFSGILEKGKDILYIAFSSSLSSTYFNAMMAKAEIADKYKERNITVIDSLSASTGYGMLVVLAARMKNAGKSIGEITEYIETVKHKLCHIFTVDDLKYLKRGGRIDPASAFVATVLNIKPFLHMDGEGKLVNIKKVRGRRASINEIVTRFGETYDKEFASPVMISHGHCLDDAIRLKEMIERKYKVSVELISDIGPVIGSHSGPGTLALYYIGTKR